MSQQPRGLPGFLRRTLRSTYDQDEILDTSTAPTPPEDTSSDDGTAEVDDADDAAVAKSTSNEQSNDGSDTTSDALSSGSKKQLRTVAFPPLPRERESIHTTDADDPEVQDLTASLSKDSSFSSASGSAPPNENNHFTNANNNNSNSETPKKSYKEIQFETTINSPLIPLRDLRSLSWNGIPPHHRSLSWKILLAYLPANTSRHTATLKRKRAEYRESRKQHYDIPDDARTNSEQETLRQVLVDVPRTAPEVPLFHNDRIRRMLTRLLYIWAMRHPASSYVQGINDLATPFIVVFLAGYYNGVDCLDGEIMASVSDEMLEEVEADTYWCLTNLLSGIQDHYTSDQPGMQRMVMRLEELTQRIDAELCRHLKEVGIEFMQFAFKWMNCLLLREFRLGCVVRLWDTYLSEGNGGFEDFHVYVCASFLVHFSSELQEMGFDELFQFMQVRKYRVYGPGLLLLLLID